MRFTLRAIVGTALLAAGALALPGVAQGVEDDGCPVGFNLGALTVEERLALPKVQEGIAAGVYTAEDIAAGTPFVDKNGNGLVCVQEIAAHGERLGRFPWWKRVGLLRERGRRHRQGATRRELNSAEPAAPAFA